MGDEWHDVPEAAHLAQLAVNRAAAVPGGAHLAGVVLRDVRGDRHTRDPRASERGTNTKDLRWQGQVFSP